MKTQSYRAAELLRNGADPSRVPEGISREIWRLMVQRYREGTLFIARNAEMVCRSDDEVTVANALALGRHHEELYPVFGKDLVDQVYRSWRRHQTWIAMVDPDWHLHAEQTDDTETQDEPISQPYPILGPVIDIIKGWIAANDPQLFRAINAEFQAFLASEDGAKMTESLASPITALMDAVTAPYFQIGFRRDVERGIPYEITFGATLRGKGGDHAS